MHHIEDVSDGPWQAATGLRFGLPVEVFARAWRIHDVASYLGLERSAAYRLMRDPSAPPRLRTGSNAYRWDGEQVMAWVRHMDWARVHGPDRDTPTADHFVPGRDEPVHPDRPSDTSATRSAARRAEPHRTRPTVAAPTSAEASTGDGAAHALTATVHVVEPAAAQREAAEARMATLVHKQPPAKPTGLVGGDTTDRRPSAPTAGTTAREPRRDGRKGSSSVRASIRTSTDRRSA